MPLFSTTQSILLSILYKRDTILYMMCFCFSMFFCSIVLAEPSVSVIEVEPMKEKATETITESTDIVLVTIVSGDTTWTGHIAHDDYTLWQQSQDPIPDTAPIDPNKAIQIQTIDNTTQTIAWGDIQSITLSSPQEPTWIAPNITDEVVLPEVLELPPTETPPLPQLYQSTKFSYPNVSNRYIFSHSSIPLQSSQGYLAQTLLYTSAGLGLTDNVQLRVGALGPIFATAGLQYSLQIQENLHISADTEMLLFPWATDGSSWKKVLIPTVQLGVTYGDLDNHISVKIGYGAERFSTPSRAFYPVQINMHGRVSDRISVLSENWILTNINRGNTQQSIYMGSAHFFAMRITNKYNGNQISNPYYYNKNAVYSKGTWDLGCMVMNITHTPYIIDPTINKPVYSRFQDYLIIPIAPWIDYTWHFGPARIDTWEDNYDLQHIKDTISQHPFVQRVQSFFY